MPIAGAVCFLLGIAAVGGAGAQDVRGTVFELLNPQAPPGEWRRAPATAAFVIVHWTGIRPGLFHYESVCLQAAIGRTDAEGRFAIAEPPPLRSTLFVFRDEPAVAVWKPGFDTPGKLRVRGARPEWLLVPTKLERSERAQFAEGLSGYGCRDDNATLLPLADPEGALEAFRAALRQESNEKPTAPMQIQVLPRSGPRLAAPPAAQ